MEKANASGERPLTRFFDQQNEQSPEDQEFPNKVSSANPKAGPPSSSGRITYTRSQLLESFTEVAQPPQDMIARLRDNRVIGLGRHILSEYVIRPVACDKLPFSITHVNPYN